ncbi:MAG: hypothetical protein U9R46_06435 [Bacteroidota bacterium]|nr:hypothetical protein [Bacteroidota bacterium]
MRKSKLFLVVLLAAVAQAPAQTNAVNPAHGLPGHRCDIAVGAPLNSAPAAPRPAAPPMKPGQPYPGMMINPPKNNTAGTAIVNTQAPATPAPKAAPAKPVQPAAPAVKTTAKLNPAHGQPGHRCDIAVGAPLNAKPAAPAAPQPAVPNTAGVKLNPPHGQPGHDCSVEVGKPLKQ